MLWMSRQALALRALQPIRRGLYTFRLVTILSVSTQYLRIKLSEDTVLSLSRYNSHGKASVAADDA